jgi:hypothetical protein
MPNPRMGLFLSAYETIHIKMIRSRRVAWKRHLARIVEMRSTRNILVIKIERRNCFGGGDEELDLDWKTFIYLWFGE